jgi:hypothetical protein
MLKFEIGIFGNAGVFARDAEATVGTDREYFFSRSPGWRIGWAALCCLEGWDCSGLARSYASVMVKEGITVNSVCPALIDTEMVRANPRANPGLIPVGRFGGGWRKWLRSC